jgi:hypothetical protein
MKARNLLVIDPLTKESGWVIKTGESALKSKHITILTKAKFKVPGDRSVLVAIFN